MRLVSPYELEYELRCIEPHSLLVPYPTTLVNNLPDGIRIITCPENANRLTGNSIVKVLDCLHAKIAVGKKGALLGSWNFSKSNYKYPNSPSIHIEAVLKIDTCDPIFPDIEKFFETWWAMERTPAPFAIESVSERNAIAVVAPALAQQK